MTWHDAAACTDKPLAWWFPDTGESYNPARKICKRCPVKTVCGTAAMLEERGLGLSARWGMRGGMTPEERWNRSRRAA